MMRLLGTVILLAASLAAQEQTIVSGLVKDPQGNRVADARVQLYRQDAGAALATTTNADGAYRFERLAPGMFLLEVEKDGFRGFTGSVRVEHGAVASVDVELQVAGVSESVVVTAAGVPQQLNEITKAISTITGDEIQQRNEYALAEVLRATPGVVITNGGGPGQNSSIRIRGLRPDAAAVLVDGLRFRDAATTQSDASSFLSTLNFVSTERVEVLRGSGSSLYGTNAVGGVVNVVTDEGGGRLHGDLQAEGGSLGLWRGRGRVGGGAWQDRLKYSAGFLHLNVTDGVDGNDATRSTGGQGFARYDLTPQASLSGRIWGSDDFVQLNVSPSTAGVPSGNIPASGAIPAIALSPAGVQTLNGGGVPAYGNATFIPGRDDPDSRRASRFYTTAVQFRHSFSPLANWQASYQRVHTSRVFINGPAGTGYQPGAENYGEYAGDIDTVDLRATAQPTPWMSVTGGYEFEREAYLDYQNNHLPAPGLVISGTDVSQKGHAGYLASQLSLLGRRLQLSFSGRAQAFRLSRPQFASTGTANNYDRVSLAAPPRALTGDVSAAYLIAASNTKLRAHFGNAYRAPSLYERFGGGFSSDPVSGVVLFSPYGDPRLSPDRYNSVDAGVDQYVWQDRVRVSATVFYSRVTSITAFDSSGAIRPDTDPYRRALGYINGSGGISRGFELGVEARPLRSLMLNGSYTYTNADLDRDITVRNFWKVFGVPAHTATLVATRQWTDRLSTNLELFRSSLYYASFSAAGRSRAFAFPGFTKADLTVNYRVWEGERSSARIYGKIENLSNERYYQNGWLASRATFVMGLGYGF